MTTTTNAKFSRSLLIEALNIAYPNLKIGADAVIFHFGDHDPSGLDMTRDISDRLTMFGSTVEVRRLALTMEQIKQYGPPPNPAKVTDSRFEAYQQEFGDESWELDSLEPKVLVELIREAIYEIRDVDAWDAAVKEQEEQQGQLQAVSNRWDEIIDAFYFPEHKV